MKLRHKVLVSIYNHCTIQTPSTNLLLCVTGAPFPANFQDVVKTIFKRLFRVYAHIYHSHFQKIVSLKEEAHLNTCFKHFVLFTWVSFILIWVVLLVGQYRPVLYGPRYTVVMQEFHLIDKGELAPLQDLVESILQPK